MPNDATEIQVLIPVQQDGSTVGGRRRNDVLALAVLAPSERKEVLTAAAAAGLVVAEASSIEQTVALVDRSGFDLILASSSYVNELEEALGSRSTGVEAPVVVEALSFCAKGLSVPEKLANADAGEPAVTRTALKELSALCSFTAAPMTVLMVAVENQEPQTLEPFVLARLRSCVREGDVVGRWADGVLAVGLGEAGRDDASSVIRRIREALASSPAVHADNRIEYLDTSLGSASGSPDLEALEAQAAQALATAQLSGPGRAVLLP